MFNLSVSAFLVILIILAMSSAQVTQPSACPVASGSLPSRPTVTVPSEYLVERQKFEIKCTAESLKNTLELRWAIYRGFYFTVLEPKYYNIETEIAPNAETNNCSFSGVSTLKIEMTEDKDGALLTCFTYGIMAGQIDCSRGDQRCAYGAPLKMARSWPLLSLEGKLLMVLVAGWTLFMIPVAIYLLWLSTRDLRPSKLVEMGDSGYAQIAFR